MDQVNKPQHLAFLLLDFLNEFAERESTQVESAISFDTADFWLTLGDQQVRIHLNAAEPKH